jgi:8-amino-7-oxononanoate synthase
MLDFTSALYLGLQHPSWSLRPWAQLTTGAPAALRSTAAATAVAQRLATLQGCEAGTLGASTLHLFWDLFAILAKQRVAIYVDSGTYPIARWGMERAAVRGTAVRQFAHHDAQALWGQMQRDARSGTRPIVVTDGFCPNCGKAAPLRAYLGIARAFRGQLVVDDTQALGIFGHSPQPAAPYGVGGGGILASTQIGGPDVVVVSSLAKAFGVPVAILAGSRAMVRNYENNSETRVHCSPPSMAAIHAVERALDANSRFGDAIRRRLCSLVARFREKVSQAGLRLGRSLFPVQTVDALPEIEAISLHMQLVKQGIRTVLGRAHNGSGPRISFLITARHTLAEIDRAAEALARALHKSMLLNAI